MFFQIFLQFPSKLEFIIKDHTYKEDTEDQENENH